MLHTRNGYLCDIQCGAGGGSNIRNAHPSARNTFPTIAQLTIGSRTVNIGVCMVTGAQTVPVILCTSPAVRFPMLTDSGMIDRHFTSVVPSFLLSNTIHFMMTATIIAIVLIVVLLLFLIVVIIIFTVSTVVGMIVPV